MRKIFAAALTAATILSSPAALAEEKGFDPNSFRQKALDYSTKAGQVIGYTVVFILSNAGAVVNSTAGTAGEQVKLSLKDVEQLCEELPEGFTCIHLVVKEKTAEWKKKKED